MSHPNAIIRDQVLESETAIVREPKVKLMIAYRAHYEPMWKQTGSRRASAALGL
jgi:hypothetical protein